MNKHTATTAAFLAIASVIVAYLLVQQAFALPGGASITSNVTAGTPSTTPANRTDARGTITTIILSGTQQDQYWKGYVGNVTGKLSLDDASGNTLYDWALSVDKAGEVYISRYASPTFSNVSCANASSILGEEGFFGMTTTQADGINKTFNITNHQAFLVGSIAISSNSCDSLNTFRNDTWQNITAASNHYFQEILLADISSRLIFTTIINATITGFDNQQYDFQIVVPESVVNSSTTYFFFTELG
jgi:hypothetical protein